LEEKRKVPKEQRRQEGKEEGFLRRAGGNVSAQKHLTNTKEREREANSSVAKDEKSWK